MSTTITLTDEQAQILGYALTLAKRANMDRANSSHATARRWTAEQTADRDTFRKSFLDRANRIEDVRRLLDDALAGADG